MQAIMQYLRIRRRILLVYGKENNDNIIIVFFLSYFFLSFSLFSWKEKDIDNGINGSIWHVYDAGRDFA
jgi:hypothetical protein